MFKVLVLNFLLLRW